VKRELSDRNKTFKLATVQQLVSDVIDKVAVEDWEDMQRGYMNRIL
jgi:hypothetical protein